MNLGGSGLRPRGRVTSMDLTQQATDATLGHAEAAAAPSPQQLQQIVAFETALFTAQSKYHQAGDLAAQGARGGPENLSKQEFHMGMNDVLGADPTGQSFNPVAFTSNFYDQRFSLNFTDQQKQDLVAFLSTL